MKSLKEIVKKTIVGVATAAMLYTAVPAMAQQEKKPTPVVEVQEAQEQKAEETKTEAKPSLSGDVEYIIAKDKADHYLRPNLFYTLPGDIQGFTFIELYKGGGYYGRTTLDKQIKGDVSLSGQIYHADHPASHFGLGATITIPGLPKEMFGTVSLRPLWIDKQGKLVDKVMAEYFVDITLPKGFKISSFGGWDLRGEGGPQWDYGEIFVGKEFGKLKVGYSGALINDGDATPDLYHRISVGLKL